MPTGFRCQEAVPQGLRRKPQIEVAPRHATIPPVQQICDRFQFADIVPNVNLNYWLAAICQSRRAEGFVGDVKSATLAPPCKSLSLPSQRRIDRCAIGNSDYRANQRPQPFWMPCEHTQPLAPVTKVRIRIVHRGCNFQALGKVVHARLDAGMGIVFTGIQSNDQVVLDKWIAELRG